MVEKDKIESIIFQNDIVAVLSTYLEVSKKGNNFWALCPFHDDSTPSLSISASKKIFKCFVCNEAGNVATFVMKMEKITFLEAIKKLATNLGEEITIDDYKQNFYSQEARELLTFIGEIHQFFQYAVFDEKNRELQDFLRRRHLDRKTLEKFQIGYAPPADELKIYLRNKFAKDDLFLASGIFTKSFDCIFANRLIFAISNVHNDVVGFSGRAMREGDEPKYKNSYETILFSKRKTLFNLANVIASNKKTKSLVLVEGFFDVIALSKVALDNVVALMGTKLTNEHAEILRGYKIIIFLDADPAGVAATLGIIDFLLEKKFDIKVVDNPTQFDPDELLSRSSAELLEVFNGQISALDFVYRNLRRSLEPSSPDAMQKILLGFRKYFHLGKQIEKDFYLQKFETDFHISRHTISEILQYEEMPPSASVYNDPSLNDLFTPANSEPTTIKNRLSHHQLANVAQSPVIRMNEQIKQWEYDFTRSIIVNKAWQYYLNTQFRFVPEDFDIVISQLRSKVRDNQYEFSPRVVDFLRLSLKKGKIIQNRTDFETFIKEFQNRLYNLKIISIQEDLHGFDKSKVEKDKLVESLLSIKKLLNEES